MRLWWIICLLCVSLLHLQAQVIETSGGTSTLYDAQGGEIAVSGQSYKLSLSAGTLSGAFIGGAKLVKKFHQNSLILGDDFLRFDLPTDVFAPGHYVVTQGAGIQLATPATHLLAFAGATSDMYGSPFFEGARAQHPAGVLFFSRNFTPQWSFQSNTFLSQKATMIQSLSWNPQLHTNLAIACGIGADEPYGAASLNLSREKYDLKAAYIAAGSQFHRVLVQTPLFSEPDRGNILLTVRPWAFLSLTGAHQDFLTPLSENSSLNARSTLDEGSLGLHLLGTALSATVFHSTYLQNINNAVAYTASRSFSRRLQVMQSYLESRPQAGSRTKTYLTNVTENINPHWGLTQMISNSNGQSTVSFGGNFLTNFLTVNANYQNYYVPSRPQNPFEQALLLDVQMHFFGVLNLHGATYVDPQGHLRYTTDANSLLVRDAGLQGAAQSHRIGNSMIHGQVVDTHGTPVDGAALMLDSLAVYTNSDGHFFVRERKSHIHQLRVLTDQFLSGGTYQIVSAPTHVRSSDDPESPGIVIVVQRSLGMETAHNQEGQP